jgi:release factor glutamine methyltransferase
MDTTALNLIKWAEIKLENSGIECAGKNAEILFLDCFGIDYEDLVIMEDFRPAAHCLNLFRRYVDLRVERYPLQYILNSTEFMSLKFELEEGIFIPRPETELLVEKALEYIKRKKGKGLKTSMRQSLRYAKKLNILDIGTGCGNIAISLEKNIAGCKIVASDISEKAIRLAGRNAQSHGVSTDITFIKSDLFDKIPCSYYNYFDIIISNGPYVRESDMAHLQPEISHEDPAALNGGGDGLCFYRRLLEQGLKYLSGEGVFIFEIGYDQSGDMADFLEPNKRYGEPIFSKDYNGYDRVVKIEAQHPLVCNGI